MSNDQQKPPSMFGGSRIILYVLIFILAISSIYMSGKSLPDWENCKESLVKQFFSDKCTPRNGLIKEITIPYSTGLNT